MRSRKRAFENVNNNNFYFLAGAANNNKHVKMKVVDDKLKIIDDVPTSAVEMAVKEKVSSMPRLIFIDSKMYFFLVLEKSPKAGENRRRDQNCAQTSLQQETYYQRGLQRYFKKMCSQGNFTNFFR